MRKLLLLTVITLVAAAGCEQILPTPDQALPVSLQDVNRIRDDEELTDQQKRQGLEGLDLQPLIINALLQDVRLANQFGGDLRSAWEKISGGRFTELTPDELQMYTDAGNEVNAGVPFDLTDIEAQAIVDLLVKHSLDDVDDLQAFLDDPGSEIPSEIQDGHLEAIFINFNPDDLIGELP